MSTLGSSRGDTPILPTPAESAPKHPSQPPRSDVPAGTTPKVRWAGSGLLLVSGG